ncbi:hypothetical protein QFZ94_000364 [Paraburkholderia sp. JPY465]
MYPLQQGRIYSGNPSCPLMIAVAPDCSSRRASSIRRPPLKISTLALAEAWTRVRSRAWHLATGSKPDTACSSVQFVDVFRIAGHPRFEGVDIALDSLGYALEVGCILHALQDSEARCTVGLRQFVKGARPLFTCNVPG